MAAAADGKIANILRFWLVDHGFDDWFKRNDDFDTAIRDGFAGDVEAAAKGDYDHWRHSADGALALIILLDQMPRNLYRGQPGAYAKDAKAVEIARAAIAAGFDMQQPTERRLFYYMPFEHCENLVDQDLCMQLMAERIGNDEFVHYAKLHRDIIARFGRFPHRNEVLGRPSTDEELAFLKEPNSSF